MPRLVLYHFRYRDPLSGKWVRARYVAERHEIAERHAEYEIVGPPELRDVDPEARYFDPLRDERGTDRASKGNVGALLTIARRGSGECRRLVVVGVAG